MRRIGQIFRRLFGGKDPELDAAAIALRKLGELASDARTDEEVAQRWAEGVRKGDLRDVVDAAKRADAETKRRLGVK